MAQVNPLTRELLVKLVYYGPGLGGKTTSLRAIHRASPAETRGQLVSLATPVDRTLYFDFLPLRAQSLRGHHVRLQLFTVPGQVYFNATRKLVLTGADGIVFVADSQRERHDANLESIENLASNLAEQDKDIKSTPLLLQLNKRDLPGVMSVDEMRASLSTPVGEAPCFETVATSGEGVMETLDALVDRTLEHLEGSGVFGAPPEPLEEPSFSRAEQALEEQIGAASDQIELDAPGRPSAHPATSVDALRRPPPPPPSPSDSAHPVVGPSWAQLFGEHAHVVEQLEQDIVAGRFAGAILRAEVLTQHLLEDVAERSGGRDVLGALAMLGMSAPRWLILRQVTERARIGGPVDSHDVLSVYGALLELRLRSGL